MIFAALALLYTLAALSQNAELQQKLATAKQTAAENKQRLLQYQWIETTQLTLKGDQKPPTQNSCRYGPDGQVQKTPIGPSPQQPSGGRMKQKIIEKKKEEMKDYMQDVKGVLGMYVPPDPRRMEQAYQAGHVALNPVPGAMNLVFSNYAQPGDKMTLTLDTTAKKITTLSVDTYMGEAKDKVSLQVHMASLPDGTNYAEQTVLNASEKKLTVTTTNSEYQKIADPGPSGVAGQQPAPTAMRGYSGQGTPMSAEELQKLAAPIALYPDALVAQILGAATFPDQVASANSWLQQNENLTSTAFMQAVNAQPWEPSVKALTQFPSVLDNLAKNLSWTSALGEAYHTQPADVMSAVQVLRAEAKAAGNLKSGSQITVVQQSPETIVIQPTNPQVVYIPQYNPTVVYGTTYVTPGYSTADVVATGLLAFGAGVAVGAAMSNSCCAWGYSYWNCNWHGGAVVYGNTAYYGNNAWHGGYYGSSVTANGPGGVARASTAYNPSTGTYARGASTATPYGTQAVGQAYNPNTGASAATHQASNAYGNYGSSVVSKNGQTAYTQHQTTAQGSVGTIQTSEGGKGIASTGVNGNYAAGETASGTKYAAGNGNVYKNTGSGWQQTQGTSPKPTSSVSGASASSSPAAKGWGQQQTGSGSSAFGGGGWQSRAESARGSASRGAGGGSGGRHR